MVDPSDNGHKRKPPRSPALVSLAWAFLALVPLPVIALFRSRNAVERFIEIGIAVVFLAAWGLLFFFSKERTEETRERPSPDTASRAKPGSAVAPLDFEDIVAELKAEKKDEGEGASEVKDGGEAELEEKERQQDQRQYEGSDEQRPEQPDEQQDEQPDEQRDEQSDEQDSQREERRGDEEDAR